eukprot:1195854-Prorocentrum_minimum.AAC.3
MTISIVAHDTRLKSCPKAASYLRREHTRHVWNQSQGTRGHIPGIGTNRRGTREHIPGIGTNHRVLESIFQGSEQVAGY